MLLARTTDRSGKNRLFSTSSLISVAALALATIGFSDSPRAQSFVNGSNGHHRGGGGGGGGGGGATTTTTTTTGVNSANPPNNPADPSATDPGPQTFTTTCATSGFQPPCPLPGLSTAENNLFAAALVVFNTVDNVPFPGGLGPRFNLNSCGGCHAQPFSGGTGPATNPQIAVATFMGAQNTIPSFITSNGPTREVRFITNANGTPDGGVHDLFVITGRSDAPPGCAIVQPAFAAAVAANNAIFRIPTPTFGLGLVEFTPDRVLTDDQAANAALADSLGVTTGVFNTSGNDGTITRFGWKAQNKSLLIFSGEAYNVEMGVTNNNFPNEREDNPACATNPTPEDTNNLTDNGASNSPLSDFLSDIENFSSFMRLSAPPQTAPTVTSSGTPSQTTGQSTTTNQASSQPTGQQIFTDVGCGVCHIPQHTTGPSSSTGQSNVTYSPFSDFAIHNMGSLLQDDVSQGGADGFHFRSAPLWGASQRLFFLHDGRTSNIVQAIEDHSSSGSEANTVIQQFNSLPAASQQALVNFVRGL